MAIEDYDEVDDDLEYDSGSDLPVVPLLAATGGAVVGAAIWAGIVLVANYEIGFIAWAIGGLIGFAAIKTGGRGNVLGIACASLALISILAGKVAAVHLTLEKSIGETVEETCTPEFFAEIERDAEDFAALPAERNEEQLIEFLASHGYSAADAPEGVSEEEIADFEEFTVPLLVKLEDEEMSFESWRGEYEAELRSAIASDGSLLDFVFEGLNAIDLLFAFLGISTAFGMVSKAK